MNKWRLLLFSVLGLLQSAAAERNFVDGRNRYRSSDTRLSIQDAYRVYKPLSESRQLNVPGDLKYRADADLVRSPAIRHFKYRELHKRSSPVKTEFLLTDHRRGIETKKFRVYTQSDRHLLRKGTDNHNEDTRLDIRRSRILERNGDRHEISSDFSSLRGNSKENRDTQFRYYRTRQYNDDILSKSERNFRNRGVSNRRTESEQDVPERRIRSNRNNMHSGNDLPEKIFVRNVLSRRTTYREPELRRRTISEFERNDVNKFGRVFERSFQARLTLNNQNAREMDVSRLNFLRQPVRSYDTTCTRAKMDPQIHVMINDNNNENIVREKRNIDNKLTSSAHLFRENHRMRDNIKMDPTYTRDRTETGELNRKTHNRRNANISFRSDTENSNRQCNTRTIPTEKGITNEIRNTRNIREQNPRVITHKGVATAGEPITREYYNSKKTQNDRLTNTRRFASLPELNNEMSTHRIDDVELEGRSRRLSIETQVTNTLKNTRHTQNKKHINMRYETFFVPERSRSRISHRDDRRDIGLQRITNSGEERFLSTNILNRDRQSSMTKPHVNIRTTENTDEIRKDRFSSYISESATSKIQHTRNAREERLLYMRPVTPSSRDTQCSITKLHVHKRFVQNAGNVHQSRLRCLFTEQRVTNDIQHPTIYRAERALSMRRMSREMKHSIPKLHTNIRSIENFDDIRQSRSRSLSVGEKETNEIQQIHKTRNERFLNTRRPTPLTGARLATKLNMNTESSRQDISAGKRITNEIQDIQNIREERYIDGRRQNTLTRRTGHSTIKLHENKRSKENSDEIRRNRSRILSNGERITNEIQYTRRSREERFLNSQHLNTLARAMQHSNKRSLENSEYIRQVRSRSTNEILHIYRAREEMFQNTRRATILNRAKPFVMPSEDIRQIRSQRFTNEIQDSRNNREERHLNTRQITTLTRAKQLSIPKIQTNIRSTENSEDIRQVRSESLSIDKRVISEIQYTRNIREGRALSMRLLNPLTRETQHMMPKLLMNKRSSENTEGIRQDKSSVTADERVTNNHNQNAREQKLNIRRTIALPGETRRKSTDDSRQERSRSESTDERVRKGMNQIRQARAERTAETRRRSVFTKEREHSLRKRFTVETKNVRQNRRIDLASEERAEHELHITNTRDKKLLNTRRVTSLPKDRHLMPETKVDKRSTDVIKDIRRDSYRRTFKEDRITDELRITRNYNQKRVEGQRSMVQFSGINNAKIESTFVFKWQYLFYLLQGIYLCSLFVQMPKETGELKKTRIADWFSMLDYLKVE